MLTGHDGRAIANYVLNYCDATNRPITNLALQKILYFCHVWTLLELKHPLIRHPFEAWPHGPVLPYVYREFKDCDSAPIVKRALALDVESGGKSVAVCCLDSDEVTLLERTIEFYSRMSASALVEASHIYDGPWHVVWYHEGKTNPGMTIENEEILRFYSKIEPQLRI